MPIGKESMGSGKSKGAGDRVDCRLLAVEECIDLLRVMAQYPDVTSQAFHTLDPHTVLQYLYRLVQAVGTCLEDGADDDDDDDDNLGGDKSGESSAAAAAAVEVADEYAGPWPEENTARLVLYGIGRQVLENGMRLLGLPIAPHYGE